MGLDYVDPVAPADRNFARTAKARISTPVEAVAAINQDVENLLLSLLASIYHAAPRLKLFVGLGSRFCGAAAGINAQH